jgi:hypothetical protein
VRRVPDPPLSSAVTHTSELALPCLKCTARSVTSAAVGTYIGFGAPSRIVPSRVLLSWTMYSPGRLSGMPITSNALGPLGFGISNCFASAVSPGPNTDSERFASATRVSHESTSPALGAGTRHSVASIRVIRSRTLDPDELGAAPPTFS